MKKFISAIMCIIIMTIPCSCQKQKPEFTSDAMYQIGLNALNAVDSYLRGEITKNDAANKTYRFKVQARLQCDTNKSRLNIDELEDSELANDFNILQSMSELDDILWGVDIPMSDVHTARDNLASLLGEN